MKEILRKLEKLLITPAIDDPKFKDWIDQTDTLEFLDANAREEFQVVFARISDILINSLFVDRSKLNPPRIEDLLNWDHYGIKSWSFVEGTDSIYITHPASNPGSETLKDADQFVFMRKFNINKKVEEYIEISQKFTQIFDIHHIPVKKAWCRLDRRGNEESVVSVIDKSFKEHPCEYLVVLVRRDVLEQYAMLTNSVLVRLFNSERTSKMFMLWSSNSDTEKQGEYKSNIHYRYHKEAIGSYYRGFQIVSRIASDREILKSLKNLRNPSVDNYAEFKCFDWKNNRICSHSCSPKMLANYYVKSDLPFELTPAFFDSEVLLNYKFNREKYNLTERSVSCRGSWCLENYGINEEGQVYTYLIYLSRLPYEEQLHWKAKNVDPKASISRLSLERDFKENWNYFEYNPLASLKNKLKNIKQSFWIFKDEELFKNVLYTYSESPQEWSDDICNLHKLLIEGFDTKWLRQAANSLNCSPSSDLQSIALIKEVLIGLDFEEQRAKEIVTHLRDLQKHRNVLSAHASISEAQKMKKKAIENHGSLRQHFRELTTDCDKTVGILINAFSKLKL